jgi:TrmH family RNA methyltransferase
LKGVDLDRLRVVLVSTRNPLNMGAAARAMSNFGALHMRVVNPYDVAFREAKSAVGGSPVLKKAAEFSTVAESIADCAVVVGTTAERKRDLQHTLRRLEDGAKLIRSALRRGRVALLFGSEKSGLTNEEMGYCHWLMRIPTREEHGSMNLGQAVAICLYELVRDTKTTTVTKRQLAASADVERITAVLFGTLRASGYVKERIADSTEQKLRRLVRRLNLAPDDAVVLLGMLRQIAWKVGKGDTK